MRTQSGPLRLLHLHSSFAPGGKELRAAKLMNAFGTGISHSVVSAQPGELGAAAVLERGLDVAFPHDFPALSGRPTPGRLQRLARAMADFDLILTYNWGAMDAAMAHTLFGQALRLPPLVHHEDGFNQDEAQRLSPVRNWYRRIALGRARSVVVPSRRLETIAREAWQQPAGKVVRIANGIRIADYANTPASGAIPGLTKQPGDLWIGTLAGLRPVKNLPRLIRAFAGLPPPWRLVIVGEGPERGAILAEVARMGLAGRVELPGFVADPAAIMGLFDLFALSSDSEQFPISVVEAMAAGLPVAAPAVGDIAAMVAAENAPYLAAPGDEAGLATAMATLAADPDLRAAIGTANRARAAAQYDEARMVAAYRAVYARALRRQAFP